MRRFPRQEESRLKTDLRLAIEAGDTGQVRRIRREFKSKNLKRFRQVKSQAKAAIKRNETQRLLPVGRVL